MSNDKKASRASEYIVREVYRGLIKDKLAKNPKADVSTLRERLIELENEKWGELVPGVPKRRNVR